MMLTDTTVTGGNMSTLLSVVVKSGRLERTSNGKEKRKMRQSNDVQKKSNVV
jgi:hypothetical protein